MKRLTVAALLLLFILGCGGKAGAKIDELQAKNEQLTQRVKALEDQLLAAEKKLIAHDLALQATNTRMREMENYFMKVQYGQTSR